MILYSSALILYIYYLNVLKNYCFEGTDIEELKRYINSIPPIDNLLSAKASVSSTTAVESRPSSRPGAISISAAPVRGRKQKPRTHGKLGWKRYFILD